MMAIQQKYVKITAIILLVLTIIWLIFTIISLSAVKSSWNDSDYLGWVSNPDFFFTGGYVNATLLTIVATILFALVFGFLKSKYSTAALVGWVFVPVYSVLNLFCYSIQISIVPSISQNASGNPETVFLAAQLIQANSHSLIGFTNGMAYAILGIPSIIYGYLLYKESKKYTGIFLALNGLFCIVGIIGYVIRNAAMSMGVLIGGVVFLISLIAMTVEFQFKE